MSNKQFLRWYWSTYLGELRPIHDIYVKDFPSDPLVTPTMTPSPTSQECRSYTASKISTFLLQSSISYTDCYGIPQTQNLENPPTEYPEQVTFCAYNGSLSYNGSEISVVDNGSCIPVTSTPTPTVTQTQTQTSTPSSTPVISPTNTSTPTQTPSVTPTQTLTPTNTSTSTSTPSVTPTNTNTPTTTSTPGLTPSQTSSPTLTPSVSPTNTMTPTTTSTPTPSVTANAVCPEQIEISGLSTQTQMNGTYSRIYSYTGGTFVGGYTQSTTVTSDGTFYTGSMPETGFVYAVYEKQSGSTYHTIIMRDLTTISGGSGSYSWGIIETSGSSEVNGGVRIISARIADIDDSGISVSGVYFPKQGSTIPLEPYVSYPSICPTSTPTPSVTTTQTPSPTNTMTPTQTQTNTPTPSSPSFCNYVTVSSLNSLDIDITDVTVSGVSVTYISGTNFTINAGDPSGDFGSNISGSSVTLRVYYNPCTSGQNITVSDCDEIIHCCDVNSGGGYCEFTIDLSCGCAWTITASDGSCV
jgi:hypothetical protein